MAKTTDELFAEATEADYETIAPMVLAASDTEEEFQFRIDEHLRTIAIPEKGVVAGVEGDLNVNIARFTMVRYYHGRDLSKLSIRINYRNANGQVNYYTVSDATVSGDSIVFSWEYAADVTQYKGNVQFVVYLFSATNATLKQRFFSTLGTLEVLEGLEVDSSIPASEQTDILLHLKKDLSAYAEEVKKSLPADYTAMTEQVSSLNQYLELSLQIHHIHQLYTTFIYWVVIIVCKEIWYYVRTDKTTFFIEWYCQWTIARSNLQNSILSAVFLDDKVNQSFCIAFALIFWNCCNVLNFKHTISFAGYDTFAFNSIIIEDIHPAIIKIAIYHVFLLISQ